jgi:hypothetical protein
MVFAFEHKYISEHYQRNSTHPHSSAENFTTFYRRKWVQKERAENQHNMYRCQFGTSSAVLRTERGCLTLWLPISCLFIATDAENIKGLTVTVYLLKAESNILHQALTLSRDCCDLPKNWIGAWYCRHCVIQLPRQANIFA